MIREDIGALTITVEGAIPETITTAEIENLFSKRLGLRQQDTIIVRQVQP